MCRLVCTFCCSQTPKTGFPASRPIYSCHPIWYVSRYMQCIRIRTTKYRHIDTATLTCTNPAVNKIQKLYLFSVLQIIHISSTNYSEKQGFFFKNGRPFNLWFYWIFMWLCMKNMIHTIKDQQKWREHNFNEVSAGPVYQCCPYFLWKIQNLNSKIFFQGFLSGNK